MVSAVSSLNIKPIRTYPKSDNRQTTITGFDDVLNQKVSEVESKKSENAKDSGNNDSSIIYRNPVTGERFVYVDVADNDKSSDNDKSVANKTSSTSTASSTTDASSMQKTKYDEYFKEAAKKYNVSESLLKAIAKAESDFDAKAVSSAGAMGVMQLMPETAQSLGVDDPFDPRQNIMGGAKCISQKLKEFNGDVKLALAAYNAGSGAVKRYGGVPSYCKTYISKVLSYKEAFETANAVG